MQKKPWLWALVLALCLSAPSFASGAGETTAADPRPGKVVWTTAQSLTSADAHMWDVSGDIQIHILYLEGLIEHVGWNKYEPALAESWEVSPDYLTYTFKLREGVTFHSGDPFTAVDVVWSTLRMKNMPTGSVRGHLSTLSEVVAVDEHTVRMSFTEPNPMIFFDLSYVRIYSKAQAERDGEKFYEKFIGTGPYKFSEWKPGEYIRFEKNEKWWGEFAEGAPSEIEHRPIPEEATRLAALMSGEVDIVPMVPIESMELVESSDMLHGEQFSGILSIDLVMKNDTVPLNNSKLRQALDLLVPRERIVNDLLGQGTPANVWSQSFYPWFPEELSGVVKPYDEARAKTLIAESGYRGELIRLVTRRGKSEKDVEICEYLAAIWNAAGLNVSVEVVGDAAFTQRRSTGDYEMYMTAWDINSPGFYYRDKFKSHKINRHIVDPVFEQMVQDIVSEPDVERFNEKVKDLERYLYKDPAALHLYYPAHSWGLSNRVETLTTVGGYTHLRLPLVSLSASARVK